MGRSRGGANESKVVGARLNRAVLGMRHRPETQREERGKGGTEERRKKGKIGISRKAPSKVTRSELVVKIFNQGW